MRHKLDMAKIAAEVYAESVQQDLRDDQYLAMHPGVLNLDHYRAWSNAIEKVAEATKVARKLC